MKKLFFLLIAFFVMVYISGCKKCFSCYNTCVQCSITVNSKTFSHVLCRDSFNTETQYNNAIAADTGLGYTCTATAPTYQYDFCTNQAGEENYPSYFNKGKRVTCDPK